MYGRDRRRFWMIEALHYGLPRLGLCVLCYVAVCFTEPAARSMHILTRNESCNSWAISNHEADILIAKRLW
jgi:hypothetical protein